MSSLLCCATNQSFFDSLWALVHFVSGLIIGILILYFFGKKNRQLTGRSYARLGFSLLMAWEYFELALRFMVRYDIWPIHSIIKILPSDFSAIESATNIISDLIMGSAGLYLAYRVWQRKTSQKQRASADHEQ